MGEKWGKWDTLTLIPKVDLGEATAEIKEADPYNAALQALTVPESVGGVVNVLLGIQYAAHFPRIIHQLESGLGIYKVKLQPTSQNFTAAIAGPHHSFDLIMGHVGDMVTMLTSFTQGMMQWRTHGPPLPSSICYSDFLSPEEIQSAYIQRQAELTNIPEMCEWDRPPEGCPRTSICPAHHTTYDEDDLEDPYDDDEGANPPPAPRKLARSKSRIATETRDDLLDTGFCLGESEVIGEDPCSPIICNTCREDIVTTPEDIEDLMADLNLVEQAASSGETLCREGDFFKVYNVSNTQVDDTDLATMKHYTANLESLIKIEYRCPRCRNCQPCRNADETEKISLREEAEQVEVEASVKLDSINKRFMCKLPLRGKPEDFLSTNMQLAEKVLDRQ